MSLATLIEDAVQVESIAAASSPDGVRIDTIKMRYPRMVHADFMTHRVFSRNGSSSRAMPSTTLLKDDPYVPTFRHNKAGMQPGDHLDDAEQREAEAIWLRAAAECQKAAAELSAKDGLNVHKQWTNRMLEWFGYITVVATSTDWTNYLGLRDHGDAQDEIIWQAKGVRRALEGASLEVIPYGQWYLPFIHGEDYRETVSEVQQGVDGLLDQIGFAFQNLQFLGTIDKLLLVRSAARCARTSYRNFDGAKATFDKDVATFLKLGSSPIHASPFEHQARPQVYPGSPFCGNLRGWEQFRKFIPNENIAH